MDNRNDRGRGGRGGFGNNNRGGNGGGFRRNNFGPREMHDAVCSECGQPCQVPFEPKEGRPVFCRECYAKKRAEQENEY